MQSYDKLGSDKLAKMEVSGQNYSYRPLLRTELYIETHVKWNHSGLAGYISLYSWSWS